MALRGGGGNFSLRIRNGGFLNLTFPKINVAHTRRPGPKKETHLPTQCFRCELLVSGSVNARWILRLTFKALWHLKSIWNFNLEQYYHPCISTCRKMNASNGEILMSTVAQHLHWFFTKHKLMILEENKNKDGPNSRAYYFSFFGSRTRWQSIFNIWATKKKKLSLSIILVG